MDNFSSDKGSQQKPEKKIKYFVNAKEFETIDKKLTARYILEKAECKPAEEYRLIRDNGHKEIVNYDEEFPVHNDESFTAIFKGVTPVSEEYTHVK